MLWVFHIHFTFICIGISFRICVVIHLHVSVTLSGVVAGNSGTLASGSRESRISSGPLEPVSTNALHGEATAAVSSVANDKSPGNNTTSPENSTCTFDEFVALDAKERSLFWKSLTRDDKKDWILAFSDLASLKENKLGRQVYVQYVVHLLRYGYNST